MKKKEGNQNLFQLMKELGKLSLKKINLMIQNWYLKAKGMFLKPKINIPKKDGKTLLSF